MDEASYGRPSHGLKYSLQCRAGIEAMVNSKVQEVRRGAVIVKLPDGSTQEVPFGACVWSTGVAIHPLMKQLQVRQVSSHAELRSSSLTLS